METRYAFALILATAATVLSSRLDADAGKRGSVDDDDTGMSVERLASVDSSDELTALTTVLVVGMMMARTRLYDE